MTTRYKILFLIDLLHDYYASGQFRDFEMVPSEATKKLLRDRQMMFKVVGNKAVVLIKVKTELGADENKPFVDLNPDDKFLFYLQPTSTTFTTITNLNQDNLRAGRRYYFSNLTQNNLDGELSLTQKVEAVAGAANYIPGDLTADGAGTVYECIASTNQTNNPPNTAFWHDRGKQQYVSQFDMLVVKRKVEEFDQLQAAKHFTIRAFGLDPATNLYTREIALSENLVTSTENTNRVRLNLAELSPGRYKVRINAAEFDVFIDDMAVYNNVFGIVEVFSHFAGNDFAFLTPAGKVKDDSALTPPLLRYKIRFANRLAFWKYNTPRHGVVAIDGSPDHSFAPTPPGPTIDFFTSGKPIPLLESPWKFKVNVQVLGATEDPLAPNPDPNLTGMLGRTGKDYYCTMNLNY
jgi:hypothetical protein